MSFWDSWDRRSSPAALGSELRLHIGSPCLYCDKPIDAPTRDHIYPRSLGGGSEKKNIVVVCQNCNQDKGDLPLFSWHRLLVDRDDPRAKLVKRFMLSMGYRMKATA